MKRAGMFAILLTLLLYGCAPSASSEQTGTLTAVFFGSESADAILLYDSESAILIDTGLKKYGKRILQYMESAGIASLDLLVISHFDKDHVGGAETILQSVPVSRIVAPAYEGDSGRYDAFIEAAAQANTAIERLASDIVVEIGALRVYLDAAEAQYEQENDRSLVARVEYGAISFLFAGDAENDRLRDMLLEGVTPCDILKVPHHGRWERLSESFLRAASPRYAVVTGSEDEPEDEELLALLAEVGAQTCSTRNGDLILTYDGREIRISQPSAE